MQAPPPPPTISDAQRRWLRIFEAPTPQSSPASPSAPAAAPRPSNTPPTFTALHTLDLSCNRLAEPLWRGLFTCSTASPHLTRLHLSDNGLGDDLRTARSTASSTDPSWLADLGRLRQLRYVSLTWNGINDEGALRVLGVLRRARELEEVDLRCNSIYDLPARCTVGVIYAGEQTRACARRGMAAPGVADAAGGCAAGGSPQRVSRAAPCGPEAAIVLAGVPTLEDIDCAI